MVSYNLEALVDFIEETFDQKKIILLAPSSVIICRSFKIRTHPRWVVLTALELGIFFRQAFQDNATELRDHGGSLGCSWNASAFRQLSFSFC